MLNINGLSYRYNKRTPPVLRDVSLELDDGQIGVLLGKNGSGKTTLFQTILGILRPDSGTICFDGSDLTTLSRKERARLVAYMPQHIHFGSLSVYDSVLMGRIAFFGLRAGAEDHAIVRKVLRDMGLEDLAMRNVQEMSGGVRQKIAIARAMVQQPRLLIFDEPTGNLDMSNERLVVREAKRLAKEHGVSILTALHDLNLAMSFGDRFFFLKDGTVKYACGQGELDADMIRDTFDVDVKIYEIEGQKILMEGQP